MDSLSIHRTFRAPLGRVYEAWSNPEIMKHWFFPGKMQCEASCDFRVGGHFRLVMRDEDDEYPHHGEYREIISQQKIVFTWNSKIVADTLVTVEFDGDDSETKVTLTHALFPSEETKEKHNNGWRGCLDNLAGLFADEKG